MTQWQKVKIGNLFSLEKGYLQSSKCTPGQFDFITAASDWKTHNAYDKDCEALIIAVAASGSLGRTHYVNGKFISSDLCLVMTPKDSNNFPINLKFYHFVFNSLREEIVKNTKSGTSKESINQTNLKKYEIPYFDLKLQHLWIEKLINTKSIKEDLNCEITHQQTLMKKLRQAILQEAIEGKLTKQWRMENPDVEPASVLLEKIKAEKALLVAEKKIKKAKPLPPIEKDEIPFEIPETWEWCQLHTITTLITDGKHGDCQNMVNSGYYFLSAKDIQNGSLNYNNARQILYSDFQEVHNRTNLEPGDICMVNTGATIGKTAIAPDHPFTRKTTFQKSVAVIKVVQQYVDQKLIKILLVCETSKLLETSWGSAINNLLLGDIKKLVIPFPPLSEQKEIVKKVDHLFTMCDELEIQINDSKANADMLMQAVLKEAFEQ